MMSVAETFTQNPLEYFAGATLRKLGVQELNPAWNLVIGERAPAVSHQIIRAEDRSRLQHDTGHHKFTPLGVGYSEDCGFANRRMTVDHRFDLSAVNVFAAGYDHVLQAVQDVKVPVCVAVADVARAKHAVSKSALGFIGIIPVALHDVGATHDQFAALS